MESLIPAYVNAVCAECEVVSRRVTETAVHTIYLGGGTPSVLSPDQIACILRAVEQHFRLKSGAEITLEANPTCGSAGYFGSLKDVGVNRISLGAQSAHPADLQLFRRRHSWADVVKSVDAIRKGGLENLSLDLIYGAPGQSLQRWLNTLQKAVQLESTHLSLYSLSIEEGTSLYTQIRVGRLSELDDDLVGDMYEYASEALEAAGYIQYEISNWAKPGYECLHNLQYWRRGPYLALGAGAHGFYAGTRYANVDSPLDYITHMHTITSCHDDRFSPAQDEARTEFVSEADARAETMILGLRLLREGVLHSDFERAFGAPIESFYGEALRKLSRCGLVTSDEGRTILTKRARLIANLVFREFV